MSGALSLMGPEKSEPTIPLNLLADFAGGGMTCVMGILVAIIERAKSGIMPIFCSANPSVPAALHAFISNFVS